MSLREFDSHVDSGDLCFRQVCAGFISSMKRNHSDIAFALQFLVFAEFVLSWFGIYTIGNGPIYTSEPVPGRLNLVRYYSFCMMC